MEYDFSGWATKNNLRCSDGRVIMQDAFKECDGEVVPLVWNHQHDTPFNVLGHAFLKNDKEGVKAYCKFNDTEQGKNAKALVDNGDISALSIFANKLKQVGSNVKHGVIREVSLVIAGANPGASISQVSLNHSDLDEDDEEAIIYTGEDIYLTHADTDDVDEDEEDEDMGKDNTVQDVIDGMTDEQKNVMYALVGMALEENDDTDDTDTDDDDEDDEEDTSMKHHNVFDTNDENYGAVLAHSDEKGILELAKNSQVGSFQTALSMFADENGLEDYLKHDGVEVASSGGFLQTNADGNVSWLFPEYKDVRPGAPEIVYYDQGWVSTVMKKVHKSPISRIRTSQVDIRNIDTLRAKGYQKGHRKTLTGNFALARRTTDPQTVMVLNAIHRDDIIDITDFDYVQYLYNIDRMMLNEELAMAIMLGDGREAGAEYKIDPDKIRPIWTDDDLYTIHADLEHNNIQGTGTNVSFGENYIIAEGMIQTLLYAREDYKGSGTPDMFITPHMLNVMLLARDMNGRRIYASKSELAAALNVGEIHTVEQFVNKTRNVVVNGVQKTKQLVAIVCNLADYHLGATKGGEITHFTQFDIDFNQQKSLIETRVSGALTKLYSAIVIEEEVNPI